MKIEGKTAVVIGGARGIGLAYCRALLDKGAKVVMGDVLLDEGTKVIADLCAIHGDKRAAFVPCDNTRDTDVTALFQTALERFGVPDIFVHNAGIIHEYDWEKCLSINIGGVIRSTTEALRHMSKAKGGPGGVIVHTASISALRPEYWGPVYSATKYAILGYTLSWSLSQNFNVTGVRFNCICPTSVETQFLNQVNTDRALNCEEQQNVHDTVARLTPEFIAEGLITLLEDDTLNGKALRCTAKFGRDFVEFQEHPIQ